MKHKQFHLVRTFFETHRRSKRGLTVQSKKSFILCKC